MYYIQASKDGQGIGLVVQGFPGCCGGRILSNYRLASDFDNMIDFDEDYSDSEDPTVSAALRKRLHEALHALIRYDSPSNVLVAMDPVNTESQGWGSGLYYTSARPEEGITLESFCTDNGFQSIEGSKSSDEWSRHLGTFVDVPYTCDHKKNTKAKDISEFTDIEFLVSREGACLRDAHLEIRVEVSEHDNNYYLEQ